MERIFGGHPLGVVLRLVIISIIVGVILTALQIEPREILRLIRELFQLIYDLGFKSFDQIVDWFLVGAVIVIPIWAIYRLAKVLGGDSKKGSDAA